MASIAIDGEDLGENCAHLRWFIIDDTLRGTRLLDTALEFSDSQNFRETHLWTFEGLDAARHLYTSRDFILAEEINGDQWGRMVPEQKFIRPNPTLTP